MSDTMRAVRLHVLGDADALGIEHVQTPEPGRGELLVRVVAAAITREELEWPEGRLPAIPSYEFSGVVVALGPETAGGTVGAEVYALSSFERDGAAAEYIALPEAFAAPKPRALSHVETAALPLAALSAWQGLFEHGSLREGERVLIHGVGGVGAFAVQLARARGAYVIATTSVDKAGIARELGAEEVVDSASDAVGDQTEPVDLVFDTAGGARLARASEVVKTGGRVVSVATEPPPYPNRPDVDSRFFLVGPSREQLVEIANLADEGTPRPVVDEVFPLAEVRRAFERVSSRAHRGKVVLRVGGD